MSAVAMPKSYWPWAGAPSLPPDVGPSSKVEVWFRMGRASTRPLPAMRWVWQHTGGMGDIIGYRLFDPSRSEALS